MRNAIAEESITIRVPPGDASRQTESAIGADLRVPTTAAGLVMFAHGSGSSRFSSRNRAVAEFLEERGFATLLLDLLTPDEESIDIHTRQHRFDIELLGRRGSREARDCSRGHPSLRGTWHAGARHGAGRSLV